MLAGIQKGFEKESSLLDESDGAKSYLQKQLQRHCLELTDDGNFVRWMRSNPKYPRNWPKTRKTYDTSLICLLDLFVTASSTAGAAAAEDAKYEYRLSKTISILCFVTLFPLGQCIGNIFLPPLSESFGRKNLYILSGLMSCLCCIIIGLVHSFPVSVTMRLLGGIFSAVPGTIIGGSVEDMFNSHARIWVVFFWTIASNIGLMIGPIISSYIVAALHWRWVFYIYAIIIGVITGFLFLIRESRSSFLLVNEVKSLRHEIPQIPPALTHDHSLSLRSFLRDGLFRPVELFFKEPIVITISIIISSVMSLIYLFSEALQPIYQSMGFSSSRASLIFLAFVLGTCLSTFTRILDSHIANKRKARGLPIRPEDKLVGMAIGAPCLAVGLWWFAWTIPPKLQGVPWILPTIPLILVGFAMTEVDTVLYGYISDSYLNYSASASAAVAFMRGILSGTFPLFTPQMFDGLGANVAGSLLAGMATVFCIIPPLFMCYGEKIRRRSRFARYSWEIQEEMGKHEGDM